MSTVAKTSIQINTTQATAGLQNLNVYLKATLGGFEGLEQALNENTMALRQARAAGDNYDNTQKKVNSSAKQGQGIFAGLKSKIIGLAAAYGSLQSAQKFVQEADEYASTTARLNVMNDGLQTTDELYNKIYKSAQRSRAGFDGVANSVAKLGIVAGDSFKNNDEIIAFIETFNKAAAVSGASTTESSNAMYQLSQAFASGRLQGDELRSVRENAPMLFKAIQKEIEAQFGKGADFKKIATDGLISPEIIKQAAFKSAGEIDKAFKTMPMTLGQTMTQAFNKITAGLAPIFEEVSAIINNPAVKNGINSVVNFAINGLYWVWGAVKKLGSAIGWLIDTFDYWKWAMFAVLYVMAIVKTATMIQAAWNGFLAVKTAIVTFVEGVRTQGLWAQFAAQLACNKAALIAAAIIVAIIALLAAIIYWLDYVVGAAYAGSAIIVNCWLWIKDMANACWIGVQLAAQMAFTNMVSGALMAADKIVNIFIDAFNSIAEMINSLVSKVGDTKLGKKLGIGGLKINTVERSNLTGNSKLLKESFEKEKKLSAQLASAWAKKPEYKSVSKAFDTGKAKGAEWQESLKSSYDNIKSKLGFNNMSVEDMLKGGVNGVPTDTSLEKLLGTIGDSSSFGNGDDAIKKALGDIADNTKQTADNTGNAEDNYELMRDVMRQRAINRVGNSGGTVKIDMVNNNSLSSQLDVNSFIGRLTQAITDAASTGAQGVHL